RPTSSIAHAASVALWVSMPIAVIRDALLALSRWSAGRTGSSAFSRILAPMRPRPDRSTKKAAALAQFSQSPGARLDCGEPPASPPEPSHLRDGEVQSDAQIVWAAGWRLVLARPSACCASGYAASVRTGSLRIFRIAGIDVYIHVSWLVVFALVT